MELVDIPENPLPPGGVLTPVKVAGLRLRVAYWLPPAEVARGTVVICPGRSEFIEKYAEVVADLLARDLGAVVIDWRGQGGSSRLLADPLRGHVDTFDAYRADLDAVLGQVVVPHCPPPYFALGHSMGGAIVLDHAAKGPAVFARAVLSAPMLEIFGLRFPRASRALAASLVAAGRGAALVPGGRGGAWRLPPFAGNVLTSDARRYGIITALARAAPDLQIGAPTLGWVHAAFCAMGRLATPAVAQRIRTPVLAFACGRDRVVDTAATERVMASLRIARTILVRHARHEILMEADAYRAQFWAAFDAFVPGS